MNTIDGEDVGQAWRETAEAPRVHHPSDGRIPLCRLRSSLNLEVFLPVVKAESVRSHPSDRFLVFFPPWIARVVDQVFYEQRDSASPRLRWNRSIESSSSSIHGCCNLGSALAKEWGRVRPMVQR